MHLITLIPCIVIMIILSIIYSRLTKNSDEKIRMIPIKVIAIILIVLEIIKQIYSFAVGYDLWHIPLHFCSLCIYVVPLFAFYNGKYVDYVRGFSIFVLSIIFLFMLIYPELIYCEDEIKDFFTRFLSFHTVIFHNLVLFAIILIITCKLHKPNTKKDLKSGLIGLSVYCIIASITANIVKVNYNNFYRNSIESIYNLQMLFINKLGWLGQLIYCFAYVILIILFALLCYSIYRSVVNTVSKIKNV